MLVSMGEILERANAESYAVPAPNVFSELDARALIEAAEIMHSPLILGVAVPTVMDLSFLAKVLVGLAEQSSVPVAVHLDHGTSFQQVMQAIRCGFTSVMLDCSLLPFEENIQAVKQVVDAASLLGISVEAELGHVGQGTEYQPSGALTDPLQAKEFIERTGIQALAVSIGTAHGTYRSTPKIDFDRLQEIKATTRFPLVLHGSSGTGDENIQMACKLGINKVNVCVDMLRAVHQTLEHADYSGNRAYELWNVVRGALRKKLMQQITLTGSEGKAWECTGPGLPKADVSMEEGK